MAKLMARAPLGAGAPIVPNIHKEGAGIVQLPCWLEPGESVVLDWGRKRTGWIHLAGKGTLDFLYASHQAFFIYGDQESFWRFPNFVAADAIGQVFLGKEPVPVQTQAVALRLMRLTNGSDVPALITAAFLEPSEYPAQPQGSFRCDDEVLNQAWQMGVDTVHLCTQPARASQIPVFAPFGNGYVQWDGCRTNREVWGGDLRASALAWYYNFVDQTPIANSLYVLIRGQHVDCSEHGLFPGSGSTRQKYYEWAFWEVVCLYEYLLHTDDPYLKGPLRYALPMFLRWCEGKLAESPDGFIHTDRSWMYTIPFEKQALPALQVVAILGLRALASLFLLLDLEDEARRAQRLLTGIQGRFHQSFWVEELGTYRFAHLYDGVLRSDLCTNCWAILADLVPEPRQLLERIRRCHGTSVGSVNLSPGVPYASPHDGTIWPYANAYEVAARFHAGDAEGALLLLRKYAGAVRELGLETMPEMFGSDGSLPILPDGSVFSLSHAWAGQASWALQRYLLGVYPLKPGWKQFAFKPATSSLGWVQGVVVTPQGPLEITLERKKDGFRGQVVYPQGVQCVVDPKVTGQVSLRHRG